MKKLSVILVILSFFAFISLNSCKQKANKTNNTEEMAPAGEDNTMQGDTTMMNSDTLNK